MPSPRRITVLAALVYAPLAAVAVVWAYWGQGRSPLSLASPWSNASQAARVAMSLGLGAALASGVVLMSPFLIRRARWARALHEELKPIIEPLSSSEILFLALASGFAEELFFRGVMQPAVGLLWASLVFGVVHTGPRRALLAWSVWAFVIGIALGAIFEWTGVLWGPILAHVWINQRNMTYIKRH